ncbi:hypothetical protein ACFQ05_31390 [Amycolatopsis umgeniensis]|uniref:Uncharacterized protein n=1 Tax=Amycolatopsis umgeniensis TaxID=336628 RepID=A0A841BFR7_9PSEU|nr:hypothetical protein [Amycolatopsis umgeniensis]MBB5857412.1 hypothetical protein [Amycolatopsis umgeniensis]
MSLGLVMPGVFLLSWLAQSVAEMSAYNAEQLTDFGDPASARLPGIQTGRRTASSHRRIRVIEPRTAGTRKVSN